MLNIVAVAAEPEFVTLTFDECGTATLTFEIARMQVAGQGDHCPTETTGSVQLHLLPADIATIEAALAARTMREAHSIKSTPR